MNKNTWRAMLQIFPAMALLAALSVTTLAEDPAPQKGEQEGEQQGDAAMEDWMAAMSPGEVHQWLAGMAGDWTYESSMWMNPEAPPMKSSGDSKKSMIMEGRFLQEEMSGEMMGRPFTGRGLTGFDNVSGQLVGSWIDNMSTSLSTMHGELDEENQRIVAHSEMQDPGSGETLKLKMVTSVLDPDHHTFEDFVLLPDGQEMKQMEITYTRKGAS